jgi:hypothetical protein
MATNRRFVPAILSSVAALAVGTWMGCAGGDELTRVDEGPNENLAAGNENGSILPNDAAGGGSSAADNLDGAGESGTGDTGAAPTDPAAPITAVVCVDAAGAEVAGAACGPDNLCRDAAGNIVEGTCQEVIVPVCPPSTSISTSTSDSVEDGEQEPEVIASALEDGMSLSTSASVSTSTSCSASTSASTSTEEDSAEDAEDEAEDGL